MSRRSKETLAVQLFPFLAVLVCTMGSLIFLLLVTTRQIRQRAVAFAEFQQKQQLAAIEAMAIPAPAAPLPEPEKVPEVPVTAFPPQPVTDAKPVKVPDHTYLLALADREREIDELNQKWKLRANELTSQRDGQIAVIARRKAAMSKAAEQASAAKSEVEKLEAQLKAIAGEDADKWLQPSEAERLALEQKIIEMKKRLRAAQAAEANASDKFQVVPFDPVSGTTRRPIFIECTETGIRFLPEDIRLTPADLDGFTNRANPLAAGTGALINYWTAWNFQQRNPKSEPEPYVLLLVRPKGEIAYYAAMRMLDPIRTAHGYELLEESTQLQLPEVDPAAKAACQAAIDRLLAEREAIFRAAMNRGDAGSVFGGTGRYAGRSNGKGPGVPNGATGGGAGRAGSGDPQIGAHRTSGNNFSMTDITNSDETVGTRSWERIENFEGRPRRRRGEDVSEANSLPGAQATGSANSGLAGRPSTTGNSAAEDELPPPPSGSPSGGAPEGRTAKSGSSGTASGGPGAGYDLPEPNLPVGENPSKKRKPKATGSLPDGSSSDAESESDDANDADYFAGKPRKSMPYDETTVPRSPKKPTMSPETGQKPKRSDNDASKQLEPEMLAGRRWGFSEPGSSIGFEREVRIDVSEDKLVIAEKYPVPINADDSRQETFEKLATALDKYSHEWGRPPQGFFWTPRLKFVVKPEANATYEQLNALMTRAGLATSHEFAKDPSKVEYGREELSPTKSAVKTATKPNSGGKR